MIQQQNIREVARVTRIQRVSAGLFVLRYASSTDMRNPPQVFVEFDAASGVSVLTDVPGGVSAMHIPGDALVVHALRDSQIRFIVSATAAGGGTDARCVLERVSCSLPAVSSPAYVADIADVRGSGQGSSGEGLSILAHVSRRGDIIASVGEWVCGPASPHPIEGLELTWPDRPAGVDILMSAIIRDGTRKALPPVSIGHFAGSRQKAAPIIGLTLNLSGPAAHLYTLEVSALFLGGALIARSGVFIELSGENGSAPLVGLKASIRAAGSKVSAGSGLNFARTGYVANGEPVQSHEPVAPGAFLSRPVPSHDVSTSNRVRVFRMPSNKALTAPVSHKL